MPTMPALLDITAVIGLATAKLGASKRSVGNAAGETGFQLHLTDVKQAIIHGTKASPITIDALPEAALPAAILAEKPDSITPLPSVTAALPSAIIGLQKPEQLRLTGTKSTKKAADQKIKANKASELSPGLATIVPSGGVVIIPARIDILSKNIASIQTAPIAADASKAAPQPLPTASLSLTAPAAVAAKAEKSLPESAAKMVKAIDSAPTSQTNPATPTAANIISTGTPAAIPAATNSAKAAPVTTQIASAFAHASAKNSARILPLHIALTPEHLGNITIKIEHHVSGSSTVTIAASQPETLATLKRDVPSLEHILTNAGLPEANRQIDFLPMPVSATQLNIGFGSSSNNSGHGHSSGQNARQAGTDFAYSFNTVGTSNVPESVFTNTRAGVDVIA